MHEKFIPTETSSERFSILMINPYFLQNINEKYFVMSEVKICEERIS